MRERSASICSSRLCDTPSSLANSVSEWAPPAASRLNRRSSTSHPPADQGCALVDEDPRRKGNNQQQSHIK
jgi:hypothetical protein